LIDFLKDATAGGAERAVRPLEIMLLACQQEESLLVSSVFGQLSLLPRIHVVTQFQLDGL